VFLLDICGGIRENYDTAVMFVGNVINSLDIDSGNVRVAAITSSTSPLGLFCFRDYNRRQAVLEGLRSYNPGGSTNTASALDEVLNSYFTFGCGARSAVRKVKQIKYFNYYSWLLCNWLNGTA